MIGSHLELCSKLQDARLLEAESVPTRPWYVVWAPVIGAYVVTEHMPILGGTEWYTSDGIQHGGQP